MRAYLIRRVLLVIPTLFVVTILVFLSVRFIPGSVIEVMVARMGYEGGGAIDIAAAKKRLGLDVPVPVQYARWIGNIVVRGTLGSSPYGGSSGDTVEARLPGGVRREPVLRLGGRADQPRHRRGVRLPGSEDPL